MSLGQTLDASMDSMEETRFKKKHSPLIKELMAKKKIHFSQTEIECLLIIYYKLQKDGAEKQRAVNKNQFRDILHNAFDMTDGAMMDRIFSALDRGPSIYVSMEIWISALSLFLRGTLDEKITYAFNVKKFLFRESIVNFDIPNNILNGKVIIFQLLGNIHFLIAYYYFFNDFFGNTANKTVTTASTSSRVKVNKLLHMSQGY